MLITTAGVGIKECLVEKKEKPPQGVAAHPRFH